MDEIARDGAEICVLRIRRVFDRPLCLTLAVTLAHSAACPSVAKGKQMESKTNIPQSGWQMWVGMDGAHGPCILMAFWHSQKLIAGWQPTICHR